MADKPWHRLQPKEIGPAVGRLIDLYKTEQAGRRTRFVRNLELYENRKLSGYSAHSYVSDDSAGWENEADRLGLCRSAVASAVASVYAPQKPKAQFQTLGATWNVRRRAYKLDRICEAILNQRQGRFVNLWAFMENACVDTGVQGVSCVKVMADQVAKRIVHKLVPHPDIFFDSVEGDEPQNGFQREPLDEGKALELYPDFKAAIRGAKPYEWYGPASSKQARAGKMVEAQYAWRLPYGPDKPGKWAVVIGDQCVDSGKWTAPDFPFVFVVWEYHREGPWASGIIDEGGRLAREAGELDLRLMHRELIGSNKRIYYQRDSLLPADLELNDAVVAVALEPGSPPPTTDITPPFTQAETEFLETKKRNFWDSIGVSQVSAAARREPGIESGVGQRTLNDTKAGRQLPKAKRYEQAFVALANQHVWRLEELYEEDKDFAVQWSGKNMLRSLKWADARVKGEEFTVTVTPSSALPHDPAGRQESVSDMYKAGLISQSTTKQLMAIPDLDSEMDVEGAETDYIDMLIETYLDADPKTWKAAAYQAPEGFIGNKLSALRRFAAAWFRARIDQQALPPKEQGRAEFNLGLLTRYIRELDKLMIPPPAPPMPGAAIPPDALPPQPLPPPPMA